MGNLMLLKHCRGFKSKHIIGIIWSDMKSLITDLMKFMLRSQTFTNKHPSFIDRLYNISMTAPV